MNERNERICKDWTSRLGCLRQEMADASLPARTRDESAKDYATAKESLWSWLATLPREEQNEAQERILTGMAKWGCTTI